jgi:hypothetical protein
LFGHRFIPRDEIAGRIFHTTIEEPCPAWCGVRLILRQQPGLGQLTPTVLGLMYLHFG